MLGLQVLDDLLGARDARGDGEAAGGAGDVVVGAAEGAAHVETADEQAADGLVVGIERGQTVVGADAADGGPVGRLVLEQVVALAVLDLGEEHGVLAEVGVFLLWQNSL